MKLEDSVPDNSIMSRAEALAVLEKTDSTMMQLTRAVSKLEKEDYPRNMSFGISSSVTVDMLEIYIRKYGLLNGVNVEVVSGNYDDPIGDMDLFENAGVEQIVLLPFFDNLMPSFEAQAGNLDAKIIDAKEVELRERFRMVFEKARTMSAIYLCTLHRMGRLAAASGKDHVSYLLARFNAALQEEAEAYANVSVIDTEDIITTIGRKNAFDTRFYFRAKAPYTGPFMDELARRITARARGFGAHFYKVLALDCDNTLWGGVIGEDLLDGIKLDPHDYPGNIFWRMQQEFSTLERQGVLLVLITKNNSADVDEVLRRHPEFVIREAQIVAKKVNWEDKPSNLRALAKELNLGLDSFVFLDDSPFECEAVRQQLPMVKTFQVPEVLSDYSRVVDEIKSLFLTGGHVAVDSLKTEHYRQRASAEELKSQFATQEEYLKSLELKVDLTRNAGDSIARISELSQKSNQFNLTTHRYSVAAVEQMMKGNSSAVFSLVVSDKFGNAGLTGVVIIRFEGTVAAIENFFMSCRVIGRGVEMSIWSYIVSAAVKRGCTDLSAEFIPSAKNNQVADFFDRLGMPVIRECDGAKHYMIAIADLVLPDNSYIEVTYVE